LHFHWCTTAVGTMDISPRPFLPTSPSTENQSCVAQPSSKDFFLLRSRDRQPILAIPDKPVEVGTVPGEWYSPTQVPIPSKPPATDRNGVSGDDLIYFTPRFANAQK